MSRKEKKVGKMIAEKGRNKRQEEKARKKKKS